MSLTLSPLLAKKRLAVWAFNNYRIGGKELSLQDYHFIHDIILDEHPVQVTIKSAQVAISETNIMLALFVPHALGKTSLYLFPTSHGIGDFVQHRVEPIIEQSPALARAVGRIESNKGANKVGLKKIGNGFAYFRGTQSKRDVISVPADCLIVDEIDECHAEHVELATERLANSTLKWQRYTGTPTYPGGPIDAMYNESDQRRYMLRCDGCAEWQWLDWYKNVVREESASGLLAYTLRDGAVSDDAALALAGPSWMQAARNLPHDIRAVCSKCAQPMNRLAEGAWQPQHAGRSVHGWHVTRLNSPRTTLARLYHKFMRAQQSIIDLIIFHRSALGTAYDAANEGLTPSALEMLADESGGYDPGTIKGEFTTAGVDVGLRLHTQISRFVDGRRVIVWHGAPRDFDELERILDQHRVDIACIDSMPETREVKRFRDAQPHGRVYMTNFGKNCDGSARDESDWLEHDHLTAWIKCDRTMVIDEATAALTARRPRAIFPRIFLSNQEWVDQMCAPRRMLVPKNDGTVRAIWHEGGKPDHYRFADVYDYLAMKAWLHRHNRHGGTETTTATPDEQKDTLNPIADIEMKEAERDFDHDDGDGVDQRLRKMLTRGKERERNGEHS